MGEECGDGPSAVTGWIAIAEPHLGQVSDSKPALELGHDTHWTASQVGQVNLQARFEMNSKLPNVLRIKTRPQRIHNGH